MPADAAKPAQKEWCDAEGNHVALFYWVEQVAAHPEYGTLLSQPHQRGEVVAAVLTCSMCVSRVRVVG